MVLEEKSFSCREKGPLGMDGLLAIAAPNPVFGKESLRRKSDLLRSDRGISEG
jgi:hypothetical protein